MSVTRCIQDENAVVRPPVVKNGLVNPGSGVIGCIKEIACVEVSACFVPRDLCFAIPVVHRKKGKRSLFSYA